jgi:hypothetical protein
VVTSGLTGVKTLDNIEVRRLTMYMDTARKKVHLRAIKTARLQLHERNQDIPNLPNNHPKAPFEIK